MHISTGIAYIIAGFWINFLQHSYVSTYILKRRKLMVILCLMDISLKN